MQVRPKQAFGSIEIRASSSSRFIAAQRPAAQRPRHAPVVPDLQGRRRYVLMQRLEGQSLAEAWPEISPEDRGRLAESLGGCLAARRVGIALSCAGCCSPTAPASASSISACSGASWPMR
jgi:hypothetical protein